MPYADPEQRRASVRRYHADPANRSTVERAKAAWRARNPEKRRAQNIVSSALRRGVLVKGSCERAGEDCGGKVHAHHDDYSKPLVVRWLCAVHHGETWRKTAA